jgi:nucleoid-associated protein YgaU
MADDPRQPIRTDLVGESHPVPEDPPETTEVRTYIVRVGDTLESIAEMFYGTREEWLRIRNANRDRIAEHDRLDVGGELRIPL